MPESTGKLSPERLRELARAGAAAAVKELRAEIIAIERTFPELKLRAKRRAVMRTLGKAEARGRKMSDAARKAVGDRVTRYTSERRRARAKIK